jgi:hypothetical protein
MDELLNDGIHRYRTVQKRPPQRVASLFVLEFV